MPRSLSARRAPFAPLLVAIVIACIAAPGWARAQDDDLELMVPGGDVAAIEPEAEDDLELVVPAEASTGTSDEASEGDAIAALRAEIAALRARVEAAEARASEPVSTDVEDGASADPDVEPADPDVEPADPSAPTSDVGDALAAVVGGLRLSGFLQAQYEWSDLSEDQLLQGGAVLNRNRFVIRRGRLRVTGRWRIDDGWSIESDLELDASTTRGLSVSLRRASIGVALREPGAIAILDHAPGNELDGHRPVPLVRIRAGLTEIPFGHELRYAQRDLVLAERTTGSLAFFRGPVDVGLRIDGGLGVFRYDFMVMSGTPLDDRAGETGIDPTGAPDLSGRLGVAIDATDDVHVAAGASFLWGTGFSPGTDATANQLEWRDLNESGTLDTGELVAIPGRAALPSSTFEHWAIGIDARAVIATPLGRTDVFGEVVLAQNLDRNLFVADPVVLRAPVRELSAYLAVTQEIVRWGLLGFRWDWYDPNNDFFEQRRGIAVPGDASIHTLSPLAGVRLPEGIVEGVRGRLVVQYDAILDALGRDARGVPADLRNDQLTVRVQGEW